MDTHIKDRGSYYGWLFIPSTPNYSQVRKHQAIPSSVPLHTLWPLCELPFVPCLLGTFFLFFKDVSAANTQIVTSCEPSLGPYLSLKIVNNSVLLLVSDAISCISHLHGNDCFRRLSSPSSGRFFGTGPIICSCLCFWCLTQCQAGSRQSLHIATLLVSGGAAAPGLLRMKERKLYCSVRTEATLSPRIGLHSPVYASYPQTCGTNSLGCILLNLLLSVPFLSLPLLYLGLLGIGNAF